LLRAGDNAVTFAETILGVLPHVHQAAYLVDAHPVRVLVAGRRSGKTTAVACEVAFLAATAAARGATFHALLTGPVTDQAKIPLDMAEGLIRRSPLGGLITRAVTSPFPVVELGPDVSVSVRPASEGGRHLRGHAFGAVYVDEAGFVSDETVQEAIMPLLADEGGRLTLASTPTVRGGLLHRLFERGESGADPRVRSFHFPTTANPHVDAAYVEAQRGELSQDQFACEWEGRWLDATDACFRWDDVLACATGASGPRDAGRFVAGFDPAKVRDRSALVVLDVSAIPRRVAHLEDLAGRDYGVQVACVAEVSRRFGRCKVAVDATGGGAVIVDLLRAAGVQVEPIVFSASRKIDLMTGLRVALEKREIAFPAHVDLLRELRWFRVTRKPGGLPHFEAAPRERDDYVCALALALAGAGGAVRRETFASLGLSPFVTGDRIDVASDDRPITRSLEDGFDAAAWAPWPRW
jgi:hypothetical protein